MKKIYILAFVLGAFSFSAHAQFPLDDIESYPLGPLNEGHWTAWDDASDPGIVTDDDAFSGDQSILIPEGGMVDAILDLGNKTSGVWQVKWKMMVPSNKSAYINMQNSLPAGTKFNFHMLWNEGGTDEGTATLYDAFGANQGQGGVLGSASYTPGEWFDFTLEINLDNLTMSMMINQDVVVSGVPYPTDAATPAIGGIDMYSNEGPQSNRFYIDDVVYSDVLSVNDFSADSFSIYPNPVSDVLNINSKAAVDNVIVYDILGKIVLQDSPGKISPSINMSSLPSGTYLVKVTIDNTSKTVKILK